MVHASGLYERNSQQREECKDVLRQALGVFQKATLINVGRSYDVNHEALIRSWKKYANWLKEARRRIDRLVRVDRMIADDQISEQETGGALRRLWSSAVDYILVEDLARADQIAGDETSADLQDIFGPDAAFSEQWAQQALERADAMSPGTVVHTRSVTERLGSVKQTIGDAIRFRNGAKNRPRRALLLMTVFIVFVVPSALYFWWTTSTQTALNEQFRFFKLQSEATAISPDEPRTIADDHQVYAALEKGLEISGTQRLSHASRTPEPIAVFRTSLRQLDRGTRTLLSDVSVRILNTTISGAANPELAALSSQVARCAVADPDLPAKNLIASEPGSRGLEIKPQDEQGAKVVTMSAIRRAADGKIVPVENTNFGASQVLVSGALVCLSHDANWFLMVRSTTQSEEPPYIQRILWIKTDRQDGWRSELKENRGPATRESWDGVKILNIQYPYVNNRIRNERQDIRSFRSGDRVGFLIALEDNVTALLWTTTGLVDPDLVSTPLEHPLAPCEFKPVSEASPTNLNCEMGPIEFDKLDHVLRAEYDYMRPDYKCTAEEGLCLTKLSVDYAPIGNDSVSTRVAFQHTSAAIQAAAIWDDALWVRDANGQVWRYVVGLGVLQKLTEQRWRIKNVQPRTN